MWFEYFGTDNVYMIYKSGLIQKKNWLLINDFSCHFKKIVVRYKKKIGYNIDVLRQTACLVVIPIKVNNIAHLLECMTVGQTSN